MTKAEAIYNFWDSFLDAYEENTVPVDANFPYITYQFAEDGFENEIQMPVSLWYRSPSWKNINKMTTLIAETIGSGIILDCDGGKIWIKKGSPFAQNMGDESDDMIRRKYINITVEYFTAN